jgi:DnaA family protein
MLFSPQIPLPLEPKRPDRFEDFIAGSNQKVIASLRALLDEPGSSLFLSGPGGSGKSHLLNALCTEAREKGLNAFYIALRRLPEKAAAGLEGLQKLDLVCVDDIDRIIANPVWETALFNCFNQVRAGNGRLVVSSRLAHSALQFSLPDLASRLAWGVRQQLMPLDDGDRLCVLQHRAGLVGIDLPDEVQRYLISRSQRDMASLLAALDRLKEAALAAKRRITVPLAREVLAVDPGEGKVNVQKSPKGESGAQ